MKMSTALTLITSTFVGETWLITPDIDVVTESVFPCPHCEYTSSKKQNLKSHINAVHKVMITLYEYVTKGAEFLMLKYYRAIELCTNATYVRRSLPRAWP